MKSLNILILLLSYTNVNYLYIAFHWNTCFCLEILLGNSNVWVLALHVIVNLSLVSNVLSLQTSSLLGNILLILRSSTREISSQMPSWTVPGNFSDILLHPPMSCCPCSEQSSSHVRMWLIPQHPAGQESHLGHVYIPRAFRVWEKRRETGGKNLISAKGKPVGQRT